MSQGSSSLKATCQITFLHAQRGQSFFLFSPSTRQSLPTEDNLCYPQFTNLNVGHVCEVASVISNSVHPYGQQPARFLYPWDSSGKNTGAGCCVLIQGIFPTQGSNPGISFKFPELAGGFLASGATWETQFKYLSKNTFKVHTQN